MYTLQTCCCCQYLVLAIVNSNSALDDNFEIFLNGVSIGTINNNSHTCTGRLWSTNTEIASYTGSGFWQTNLEPTLLLDTSLLVANDVNELAIVTTQANHNGNFGNISLHCVKDGDSIGNFVFDKKDCDIQQTTGGVGPNVYSFGDFPVGHEVDFTFTWDGQGG